MQALALTAATSSPHLLPFFFVNYQNRYVRVGLEEIRLLEADGQAVKIHTTNDIIYEVKVNLGHLLSQLPHFEPYLLKVSRRHVVNIQAIEAIEGNVLFIKGHQVPISRRFHGSVMEQLPLIRSRSHIHTS